jgi:hypothetical protein
MKYCFAIMKYPPLRIRKYGFAVMRFAFGKTD